MPKLTSSRETPLSIPFLIIILPFMLFYWMAPFATDLTLGYDYQEFSIQNQMELLFSIKTGSFPLYAPGYALGHSSSALTLGQVYHPLPYVASVLPGYWEGKALEWHTLLRLFFLGLTHLALFAFLRQIKINTIFSFILSFITVYNLRMLDLFRFGASLETYTGFLLLCTAIGLYFIKPTKLRGPLSIIGATYLLICSGHPTMMFFALLGTGLFLLVTPFFIVNMLPDKQIHYKDALIFYIKAGFCVTLGISLSSAYIFPFYFDFMSVTSTRVALADYDTFTMDTFFGTLSNFFMPFFSDVHGAFGGSSLLIIAAILPIARFFKMRIPNSIWFIWGFVLIAFLYMQGSRTPVHRWAWEYLPFVSSLRGAERISLIMPVLIMLLLAWIMSRPVISLRVMGRAVTVAPYMLLAFISLLLISAYSLFSILIQMGIIQKIQLGVFPPKYINNISLQVISIVMLSGAFSLMVLVLYSAFPNVRSVLGILLCLLIGLQIGVILRYGSFMTDKHEQPSFEQMKLQKKLKLDYLYNPGSGMYSSVILTQLNRSFLEPFLGKLFTEIIPVSIQDQAYERMEYERLPQQVIVENFDPEMAKAINKYAKNMKEGRVNLVYSSFNRLQFRVNSESPAIFGLSYPHTGHWKAWVNGNKVTVYRANGSANAVEIPKGESLIEFRYWSTTAFWGMIISCSTFTLIGLYICFKVLNGLPRAVIAGFVLIIGLGAAMIWNHSLYTGDNLGTQFTWTYTPPVEKPNLAYGKKTSISPLPADSYNYMSSFYHSHRSRVVDGDKSPDSGYIVKIDGNPAVIIDLYQRKEINSVVIYESIKEPPVNTCHLELAVSQDKKQWDTVSSVTSAINNDRPITFEFESPKTARYVKIKASGYDSLSLDEVEVYGK